jgi:hypothetical protein
MQTSMLEQSNSESEYEQLKKPQNPRAFSPIQQDERRRYARAQTALNDQYQVEVLDLDVQTYSFPFQ